MASSSQIPQRTTPTGRTPKPRPKQGFGPVSPRILANRRNGSKGGQATTRNHTEEWLQARAARAGTICKLKYGTAFYSYITRQQIADGKHKGWPKGRARGRRLTNNVKKKVAKVVGA